MYETHPLLIVLVPLQYYFSFNANQRNMVHVDDNLASSGHKTSTASLSCTTMAELDWRNQNSLTRKGLACYDCCHYIAQSDTETDNNWQKHCRKTHMLRWHIEKKGGEICYFLTLRLLWLYQHRLQWPRFKLGFKGTGNQVFFWAALAQMVKQLSTTRVSGLIAQSLLATCEPGPLVPQRAQCNFPTVGLSLKRKKKKNDTEDVGKVSTAASATAEAGSSPSEMQVSKRIVFVSYRLSTMASVVCHDIFPWSPVSSYKSQQCCQNSRAASAESICKVSSWALASSGALQSPVILCCLWPLSATQSFLQLS